MSEPDQSVRWHKRAWCWSVAHSPLLIGLVVALLLLLVVVGHLVYPYQMKHGSRSREPGIFFFVTVGRVKYFALLCCAVLAALVALARHRGERD